MPCVAQRDGMGCVQGINPWMVLIQFPYLQCCTPSSALYFLVSPSLRWANADWPRLWSDGGELYLLRGLSISHRTLFQVFLWAKTHLCRETIMQMALQDPEQTMEALSCSFAISFSTKSWKKNQQVLTTVSGSRSTGSPVSASQCPPWLRRKVLWEGRLMIITYKEYNTYWTTGTTLALIEKHTL